MPTTTAPTAPTATAPTATASFDLAPATLTQSAGWVERSSPCFWKEGRYDFPPEAGGVYEMTAEDNRRAVEAFRRTGKLPIKDTHVASVFDGHIGDVVDLFPADPEYRTLGLRARVKPWLHDLFGDQPLPLSANWCRATRTLKDVAIVPNPRIEGAAMFASFAARAGRVLFAPDEPPAGPPPAPAPAPTMTSLTISGDPEAMAKVMELCKQLGLQCHEASAAAAFAASERQRLQAQIDALKQAHEEARFSAACAKAAMDAEQFADTLVRQGKLSPAERSLVIVDYQQASRDDLLFPTEVHFADVSGATLKGSRVAALRARHEARPESPMLKAMVPPDQAQFHAPATTDGRLTPERKKELLAMTPLGRQVLTNQNGRA